MHNLMNTIKEMVETKINNTRKTQVATTYGTYKKTGAFLKDKIPHNGKVLSVGAGLDQTKKGLYDGLGGEFSHHTIHDHEPNPEGRQHPPEFTDAKDIPKKHYDAVVCHNVLNVVEPHVREHVMHSIFNSVKDGGHVVIGARKWTGDVALNKNHELGSEPRSMWVIKGKERSYQKGFDGSDLKNYVEDYAKRNGHSVTVSRVGLAATGVHVTVHGQERQGSLFQ